MISQQNEARNQANIPDYLQSAGYQAGREVVRTCLSFSEPLTEVLEHGHRRANALSTDFIRTGAQASRQVSVQRNRFVIATRRPDPLDTFVYAEVTICFSAMEVRRSGRIIPLTRKEFNTLSYLVQNAPRVISRDELLNKVWGHECYPCTRTVDNHILRLRKKLEPVVNRPKHLRTVHGVGYRFLP